MMSNDYDGDDDDDVDDADDDDNDVDDSGCGSVCIGGDGHADDDTD